MKQAETCTSWRDRPVVSVAESADQIFGKSRAWVRSRILDSSLAAIRSPNGGPQWITTESIQAMLDVMAAERAAAVQKSRPRRHLQLIVDNTK